MTVKYISIPSKRLAETINGSAYTFSLNNILGWDNEALTASDFGTKHYIAFRNSAGTKLELMEINPATIADPEITILKRGLGFDGNQVTEVPTNIQDVWVKGDTIVELGTHASQLLEETVRVSGDQTIAGVKTFSEIPKSAGVPTDADHVMNYAKAVAMLTGSTSINRIQVAGTAGENLTVGNLVYLKLADGLWWKCDADTAATVENIILGIAQATTTAGNSISGGVLLQGVDTNQTGLTDKTTYYAGNTAGAISSTPGTNEVTLGVSRSTSSLLFVPRYNQQLTEDQQDALVGSSGTPKLSNPFLTENDSSNAATKTATTISFTAASKTIADSANGFVTAGFRAGDSITVSGTVSNNGTFTIVSVAAGAIVVAESLVNESAGSSFTIATVNANKLVRMNSNGELPSISAGGLTGIMNLFGDGSDGDVVISSNTTLTSDKYYNNLTVNSTFTLNTAGYRVFVKGTLINNGTIACNGGNASNSTGGVAGGGGSTASGGAGGAGGSNAPTFGGGGGGGGGVLWISANIISVQGTMQAIGGNGANGVISGGTNVAVNGSNGGSVTKTMIQSGSGGAAGVIGGGGGGTAGSAGTISSSTMNQRTLAAMLPFIDLLSATALGGGAGGAGGASTVNGGAQAASGGGGGQGGNIFLLYHTIITTGTTTVTGGTGGTGASALGYTGGNGSAGSAGRTITVQI